MTEHFRVGAFERGRMSKILARAYEAQLSTEEQCWRMMRRGPASWLGDAATTSRNGWFTATNKAMAEAWGVAPSSVTRYRRRWNKEKRIQVRRRGQRVWMRIRANAW